MTSPLALTDQEKSIVRSILCAHLPHGTSVHVFGSRASASHKPYSDLDLVLEAPQPLALATMACLAEAFDESSLPWKVDLVDRRSVSAAFGIVIDRSKVALE